MQQIFEQLIHALKSRIISPDAYSCKKFFPERLYSYHVFYQNLKDFLTSFFFYRPLTILAQVSTRRINFTLTYYCSSGIFLHFYYLAQWLGRWIPNYMGSGFKTTGCLVAFYPFEINHVSSRKSWRLNGKKAKPAPRGDSLALRKFQSFYYPPILSIPRSKSFQGGVTCYK